MPTNSKNPWKSYTFTPQSAADRFPKEITSLQQAIDLYIESRKMKRLAAYSIRNYKVALAQITKMTNGAWPVTPEHIYLWRADPDTEAHEATTINTRLLIFRGFWKWLRTAQLTTLNDPSKIIELIREKPKDPRIPTTEEIKSLIAFCRPVPLEERVRAAILVIIDTGLRISEYTHLCWDNVKWEEQAFRVIGKGGKPRTVPFGNNTLRLLKRRFNSLAQPMGADWIFPSGTGNPVSTQWMELALRRLSHRARLSWAVHPHALRHYAATEMCKRMDVMQVKKILGHESVKTTERYVHLAGADVRAAHATASPGDWLYR